jgi:miniconductance mechanosensitive channel
MDVLFKFLVKYIREIAFPEAFVKPIAALICIVIIISIAWIAHYIARRTLIVIVSKIANRTKTIWDDILLKNKVFSGIAHFVPAFILYYAADFSYPDLHRPLAELTDATLEALSKDYYFELTGFLIKISKIYFIAVIIFVANSLLNSIMGIYDTTDYAHHRPIKGYIQLVKIFFFFLMGILLISVLLGRDPTVLLAGLGAMAAVLMLVFKDTILGFVASIQLSANEMVKIGDWIEMKSHGADGDVIDITLNTVKVQNWDKTISTIPTYALVSESFTNWKGMQEAGGRRIKRSVSIDMSSIRFCDEAMLKRFERFDLICDYVKEKEEEIREFNKNRNISEEDLISGRGQTNVGIFRKYLEVYLYQHPMVSKSLTFLVRQLQPTSTGLPIEIYVFSTSTAWAVYEGVQSDIFDHVLAVIPEFELKVFQQPSGADISNLVKKA